jgi:peptide/nickel transport system permease protein
MDVRVPVAPPPRAATPAAEQVEADRAAAAAVAQAGPGAEERVYVASPWRLAWWKFLRHRAAVASGIILILLYLVAVFADFVAPYGPNDVNAQLTYAPPTPLHLFDESGFRGPYVHGLKQTIEPVALRRVFTIDTSKQYPVQFFVQGAPYKLAGLIPWDRHLYGVTDPEGAVLLAGADKLGQDVLSRTIHGTRISMSISLAAVFISLLLGIVLGGISGFYGGTADDVIQRIVEVLRSFPQLPLWLALSAAVPKNWSVTQTYFAITVLLAVLGWTGLARVVRGRFLALREEDFVTAARLAGSSERRIIFRHMLPSFASHIIASVTLAIPGAIIAETSLSFLGVGMRPPAVSWGVLLQDAQNIRAVASAPWLMLPALMVIIAVLTFNFLGDGLRDAADPYAR